MALLSRLFGSKNKQTTPAQSKIELSELSAPALLEVIKNTEQNEELRLKAIQRLPFGDELVQIVQGESNSKIQNAGAKRVAALIDEKLINFSDLKTKLSEDQCLTIASYCKESDYITKHIENEQNEEVLASLAVNGTTSKIRQAAANKVDALEKLVEIQKEIKTRDKSVYKIVKDKIEARRKEERIMRELNDKLQSICQSLEGLSKTIDTGTFHTKLKHYEKQWNDLSPKAENNALTEQYHRALEQCKNRQKEIEDQLAKANAKEYAEQQAKQLFEQSETKTYRYVADLYSLTEASPSTIEDANTFTKEIEDSWHEALNNAKPSKAQSNAHKQALEHVYFLIHTLSTTGTLTELIAKLESAENEEKKQFQDQLLSYLQPAKFIKNDVPQVILDAQKAIKDYEAEVNAKREREESNLRQLSGLIRKVNAAITQGNLRQASGLRNAINERLELIEHLPKRFLEQIESLDEGIAKLQDYRNFAVEPKKRELIAEMEILANDAKTYLAGENNQLDREDLADQVKKLQSDWKELVYGGKDTQPELWETFHELSQQAYEPCKEFFNEKSEERQANLEKRKQLLNQIETYLERYDWEQADWKDVETVLRTAKQEWSSYTPVERAANTPVQKSFNQVLSEIQKLIDEEYQKNKKKKEALVEATLLLLKTEDTNEAIEKVKTIQTKWKTIGKTWQKEENKLWKEYRSHCDAIFERKDKEREAFKSELDSNRKEAEKICETIESFSENSGQMLLDKRSDIESLTTNFESITPLPKNREREIRARFSAAIDKYENAIYKDRMRQENESWNQVFALKSALNAWQIEAASSLPETPDNSELESSFAAIEKWPSGTKSLLEKAKETTHYTATPEEREKTYKLLCIELETATDTETPSEDQALRMEFQVNRLKAGLMNQQESKTNFKEKLSLKWLELEPIEPALYEKYQQRFQNLLNK